MKIYKDMNWNAVQKTLIEISEHLSHSKTLCLKDLPVDRTALFIVDMVNGFVKNGPMSSNRIYEINQGIANLVKSCNLYGISCIAFRDCHTAESLEFLSYPPHCLINSEESEITEEIQNAGSLSSIPKNSTNGFLELDFQKWMDSHPKIDHFIIVGDCTDLCISQFSITLKADFNRKNKFSRILVPIDLVETYDLGLHNGDLMNLIALYDMELNGIELISNFTEIE